MEEFNAYYFPWVRKGLGTYIDETDSLGENDGVVLCRPELTVKSKYTVQHERPEEGKKDNESEIILEKTVKFTGPGDILRVNTSAVMKVHPEAGSEGFPTQYLPYIEFWEPDFLWRYTPASENEGRLRPWMALLVCPKELVRIGTTAGNTSYFTFIGEDADWDQVFPDVKLLHRSAHAQGNEPDKADFCRLLGMRNQDKLVENTDYVALLVPAYETGRLRGLGLEEEQICDIPAQQSAWEATMADQKKKKQGLEFPIYYKWFFKAGTDDFDTIAARLEPVGEALKAGLVLDVTDMGEGFSYNTVAHGKSRTSIVMPAATLTPQCKSEVEFPAFGVAKYQTEEKLYKNLNTQLSENPVFAENRANIRGNDAVDEIGADDPMVVPPVYGARHAMATKLDEKSAPWLKELNMDVHHRAAAGLGRKVVQKHQEELMDRAWKQVEAVQALNMELCQRLMSINANKALQRKSLDLFVDDNDPSKFLGYFMRYLVTMKNAAGENAPSLDSIIKQAEIPASFATPSFQQNADKLAKVVADLDSTTLMENIVKNQLYKFTPQEPVGAVDLTTLRKKLSDLREGLTYGVYQKYWSDLYSLGVLTSGGITKCIYSLKRVELIDGLPVSSNAALQLPLKPYHALQKQILSLRAKTNMPYTTLRDAFINCTPDSITCYPRLYAVEPSVYEYYYKGRLGTKELVETADGLTVSVNKNKSVITSDTLLIPTEQYNLFFDKDDAWTRVSTNDKFAFTNREQAKSCHNNCLGVFPCPCTGGYIKFQTSVMDYGYLYQTLSGVREGIMTNAEAAIRAIQSHLYASLSHLGSSGSLWSFSSFAGRVKLLLEDKAESIFIDLSEFEEKVQKGFYSVYPPRNSYFSRTYNSNEYLHDYFRYFTDPHFDSLNKSYYGDYVSDTYTTRYLAVFLYYLQDYPRFFNYLWTHALKRNTFLPILCYLDEIGPWMTMLLVHTPGSCYPYLVVQETLAKIDDFLMNTPAFVMVDKSVWEQVKHTVGMEGGIRAAMVSVVNQLYPKEYAYHNEAVLKIQKLMEEQDEVIREEKPVVPVDNKAVTQLKESLENKEAIDQMRKVARTYYDHFYADTEEGKRLRQKYIDELLMSKYPILAYPFFPEPTYYYLNLISDKFIIPGLDQIPMDHIAMFTSNPEFTEAFLCGMNTEMGSELQWREYPTDRRGSYFRKFWDSESSAEAIREDKFFDVKPLHLWNGTNLGENHLEDKGNLLIFAIHSDLFKLYPNTHVFLNKAEQGRTVSQVTFGKGRKDPVMETFIRENVLLVGFNISLKEALGAPKSGNYGYLLAFEQDLDDLNFTAQAKGLDDCKTSAETANLLKDKVTIFGKHISRFMDA